MSTPRNQRPRKKQPQSRVEEVLDFGITMARMQDLVFEDRIKYLTAKGRVNELEFVLTEYGQILTDREADATP